MQCGKDPRLFDHLVGAAEQRQREGEPERLGSFEVDDQFDLRDLLNRQIDRFIALENTAGQDPNLPRCVMNVGSVAHQPTSRSKLAILVYRWYCVPQHQDSELCTPAIKEWIGAYGERANLKLDQGRKDCIEIAFATGIQEMQLQSECTGCRMRVSHHTLRKAICWVDQEQVGGQQPLSILAVMGVEFVRFRAIASCNADRRYPSLRQLPSRPGEFHPEPLTDPDLTLSRHPARATARRLPPSVENWSSSCCQLARSQRR